MEKQIVKFVVDKELDIANHFIALNSYKRNRDTGSLILIDEATNNVVGAGMIFYFVRIYCALDRICCTLVRIANPDQQTFNKQLGGNE